MFAMLGLVGTARVPVLPHVAAENFMMIRGTVIDEATQRPLVTARIRVASGNVYVFTDSAGQYQVDSLRVSNVSVLSEAIGYIRETREVEAPFPPHVVCGGDCKPWRPIIVLNFYMRRKPEALM